MRELTLEERKALAEVAGDISANPAHLAAVIDFESGWDPQAANPTSSARGLIQFTDATARSLGYTNSRQLIALHSTAVEQLVGPVKAYFRGLSYSYPTLQSLAMAVFYPAARRWDPGTPFPTWVQSANRGIVTVADYVGRVERRMVSAAARLGVDVPTSGPTVALAIVGAVLLFALARGGA